MAFLEFDQANLIQSGARILIAPITATLPTTPKDIFDVTSPYAPKTNWTDIGATAAPSEIHRNLTTAGVSIEQSTSTLLEEPTDITRTLVIKAAEWRSDILAIAEESTASAVAAATKLGSGSKVPFGNIFSLSSYRLCLAGRRSKKSGIVTEGSGGSPVTRGGLVVWAGFRASIVGEDLSSVFGKGQLTDIPLTFKLTPDPASTTEGQEFGWHYVEDVPQTIALT